MHNSKKVTCVKLSAHALRVLSWIRARDRRRLLAVRDGHRLCRCDLVMVLV